MNSVCRRLKKISLEMRVFGYKNNSQLDLDSFLQFVGQTRLKVAYLYISNPDLIEKNLSDIKPLSDIKKPI